MLRKRVLLCGIGLLNICVRLETVSCQRPGLRFEGSDMMIGKIIKAGSLKKVTLLQESGFKVSYVVLSPTVCKNSVRTQAFPLCLPGACTDP